MHVGPCSSEIILARLNVGAKYGLLKNLRYRSELYFL